MSTGFYEILGVNGTSNGEDIASAYHVRLAELVRRLRAARKQGADVSILEGQERTLREAMQVLSDPVRRQRYDVYLRACSEGMPENAEALWDMARTSLVDPVAVAAVDVLRSTTTLDVGNPFPDAPKPRKWVARPVISKVEMPAPPPAPTPAPAAPPTKQAAPSAPDPDLEPTEQMPPSSSPSDAPLPVSADDLQPAAVPEPPLSLDDIPAIMERYGPDGRFIHAVRELRGMQLEDLAQETRISLRYLHAIESNDFDSLPAATFVRGYVKEIAQALDISDVDLIEGYMGLFTHHRG